MRQTILFVIDVEPDGRADVRNDSWSGCTVTLRELSALRCRLEDMCGSPVRFNWFFRCDPQIQETWGRSDWVRVACPRLLEWVIENQDFTGIHLHFWRRERYSGRWFNDFLDSNWRAQCLTTAIAGYQSIFGVRPIACRMGDRWMANELIKLLQAEGIRYDLTVEPGLPSEPPPGDRHATAWSPDYRRAPRVPYHPSTNDFLLPDTGRGQRCESNSLWIIPMTTTQPFRWIRVRRFPFLTKASRPLNLVLHPRATWDYLASEIDAHRHEPLNVVLRSGDLANRRFFANFSYVTKFLATYPGLRNCRFTGVEEAVTSFVQVSAMISDIQATGVTARQVSAG